MHRLKLIGRTVAGLVKQGLLLPWTVAVALRSRRQRLALLVTEDERLDRIRNPSKYIGK